MDKKLTFFVSLLLNFILFINCSNLFASATEMEMNKIDLTEYENTDIEITKEEETNKKMKGVDISKNGEILVTLKENTINFYDSDAEFQFCIKASYSGTIIGFWHDDEIIVKFNRGDFALGLNKEGTVVSAYEIYNNSESAGVYRELISERKITSDDYIYFFNNRTALYRTDLQGNNMEVVYKNHSVVQKTILHVLLVVLFFLIVVFAIIVRFILPLKRQSEK